MPMAVVLQTEDKRNLLSIRTIFFTRTQLIVRVIVVEAVSEEDELSVPVIVML